MFYTLKVLTRVEGPCCLDSQCPRACPVSTVTVNNGLIGHMRRRCRSGGTWESRGRGRWQPRVHLSAPENNEVHTQPIRQALPGRRSAGARPGAFRRACGLQPSAGGRSPDACALVLWPRPGRVNVLPQRLCITVHSSPPPPRPIQALIRDASFLETVNLPFADYPCLGGGGGNKDIIINITSSSSDPLR